MDTAAIVDDTCFVPVTVKLANALVNRLFATGCVVDDDEEAVLTTVFVSAETTLADAGDCKSVGYSFVFANDELSMRIAAETATELLFVVLLLEAIKFCDA